jgi:putative glutamine amidotransferase
MMPPGPGLPEPSHTHHSMPADPPLVLVSACNRLLGEHPFHVAGRKYVDAVRLAGALPLVLPRLEPGEIDAALAAAHGVLLTGSKSNVHPHHFGEEVLDPTLPLDAARDAWTLPLIRRALALGVPLLGICRGAQEVNVALGGTLHQAVHAVPGLDDHRSDDARPAAEQYAAAHPVRVLRGGLLAGLLDTETVAVNSLHGQSVARLADGLRVEALAPDGVVEAFSHPGMPGFNLCVQWHPEWLAAENPVSRRLFAAFGQAVRAWRDRVRGPLPAG